MSASTLYSEAIVLVTNKKNKFRKVNRKYIHKQNTKILIAYYIKTILGWEVPIFCMQIRWWCKKG